jgi:Tol biopolymer transport system component
MGARLIAALSATWVVGALFAAPTYAFPGQNGKLAFESVALDARLGNVFSIDPDGTDRMQLTTTTGGFMPRWSPDGTKIAFTAYTSPDNFNLFPHVYVMNPDGTGITEVVDGQGATWSPDGQTLAYTDSVLRQVDIFTIRLDGTGKTRLTNNGLQEVYLDWSPDGSRIAFGEVLNDVWTIGFDGSPPTRLTTNTNFDFAPRWSPDGTKIAFVSDRDADHPNCSGSCNREIYVMNADGSSQTRVTVDPARDEFPAWSPDGTKIAFTRGSSASPTDLYTMNADGSGVTNVTNSSVFEARADWQPLPGPRREDYRNAAHFCKAQRQFLAEDAFRARYGGGANAHGKCVSNVH